MEIEQQQEGQEAEACHKTTTNNDVNDFPVSAAEAMNPSRRSTMEDAHSILRSGTWNETVSNLSKRVAYI